MCPYIGTDVEHQRSGRNQARGSWRDALIKSEIDRKIDPFVEVQFPIHIASSDDHARLPACERARADDCAIEHTRQRDFSFRRQHGQLIARSTTTGAVRSHCKDRLLAGSSCVVLVAYRAGAQLAHYVSADWPAARSRRFFAGPGTMNWLRASSANCPPSSTSSSKAPLSTMRPDSNTRIRLALRTVASRCAITKVVRPFMTSARAAWILVSVRASSALVASSRMRIGGSLSSARAIDRRWRSPPENNRPRSP